MKSFGLLFSFLILSIYSKAIFAGEKNEFVIGIGGMNGIIKNVRGLHHPVTSNPGINEKTITLSNDKFYSKPHLELGYNRQIIGGLYLNSSLSTFSGYTDHTSGRFEGGFEVANFPRINIWGNLLEIGPNYRFNNNSSFTPFIGINTSYLFGAQDNTRFSLNPQEYGVGGEHTHVKCFGFSPEIGFFKNSGFLKGLGLKIDSINLNCSNGNMRSFFNGYDGEFSQLRYQINFRIF